MAARAMWKGVIRFADVAVPVKLYSAVEDRSVHFKLLHQNDGQPVRQAMVNPETDEVVDPKNTLRSYHLEEGKQVLLNREELASLTPEKSRDIEIRKFLPRGVIDHRWYDRPYYLGPDDSGTAYAALAKALETAEWEGLAHWVMRNKEYFGALTLFQGYPMLMSLRYADEVVSASELEPPAGKPLDERELGMAKQLIGMLDASFTPEEYQDEYRERVMTLIEQKAQGETVSPIPRKRKEVPIDLSQALEASLAGMRHAQR